MKWLKYQLSTPNSQNPKPSTNGTSRLKRDPKGALAKKSRWHISFHHSLCTIKEFSFLILSCLACGSHLAYECPNCIVGKKAKKLIIKRLVFYRWYHGSITRHEAENALRLHEEGSFLVRNSESSSNDYSLSVK